VSVPLLPFEVVLVGIALVLIFASAWMAAHPEDDDEVER
jgi:hypothetical protein